MSRLSIAVIGCGIIARARYFPALHALGELFDLRALCDHDPAAVDRAHQQFPRARPYTDHAALLAAHAHELDAVILLTGGDHTDLLDVLAAARMPTLTEKPLAYTRAAATRITTAFDRADTPLQVGYMKRHYPALARLQDVLTHHHVTTVALDLVHPPEDTYLTPVIGHGRDATGDLLSFLDTETTRPAVHAALDTLGVPADATTTRRGYVLLTTSVVHDINLLRALLGHPTTVPFAHFWNGGLSGRIVLDWNAPGRNNPARNEHHGSNHDARYTGCLTYTYVATGGYTEILQMIADDGRWSLHLPSPYLPHMSATLHTTRGSTTGLPITTTDPVSLHDPFHQQLRAFHRTVDTGERPTVDGADATADLDLIERIMAATTSPAATRRPTEQ